MLRARAAIGRAPPCAAAAARCGGAMLRGIAAAPRRPILALRASAGADDAKPKPEPEPSFEPNLEPLADVAKAVSDTAADVSEAVSETGVPASAKPKPKSKAAKKAEEAAAAEAEAKKAEAKKAEAKKAEAPKAEAKKAEAPKAEAKKAEAPKAEAKKDSGAPTPQPPKPEAPKPAAAAPKAAPPPPKKEPQPARHPAFEFACPICNTTTFKMDGMPAKSGNLVCPRCSRKFAATEQYIDLTLTSGLQAKVYNQRAWAGQELFRSPLVSFVYERGWRQGFSWAGFPGADTEFRYALDFLQPAYGETLLDMSCGSGLFSRRFAKSGRFSGVIAADFSETMLQQARSYFKEDGSLGGATPITLLRADVGRLPFATGSLAAVHAGAALHCWPNPQAALAEISRVLRPGGVFVASTFLVASAPLGQLLNNDELVRPFNQLDPMGGVAQQQYKWWEEQELKDLCNSVGLDRYTRERSNRFIMLCARKPGNPPAKAA